MTNGPHKVMEITPPGGTLTPLWAVPGAAAVILYLPAFNQGFDKATWIVVDLIFIPIFVVAGLTIKGRLLEAWISSGD